MDGGTVPRNLLREATADDVPWIMSLGYSRYGPYDPGPVLSHIIHLIRSDHALFIRNDRAFAIGTLFVPPWRLTPPECNVLMLCSEPGAVWDAVRCLRRVVSWAKDKGCIKCWFGSETEYDISAVAKRVGGVQEQPRFRIDL